VSTCNTLDPVTRKVGSALDVEFSEILKLASLGNILLVIVILLLLVTLANLLVLCLAQSSRDVRVISKLALLKL